MRIPKVEMVYRIDFFNADDSLFATKYVRPENIHYWFADYSEDGHKATFNKIWVSPERFAQIV